MSQGRLVSLLLGVILFTAVPANTSLIYYSNYGTSSYGPGHSNDYNNGDGQAPEFQSFNQNGGFSTYSYGGSSQINSQNGFSNGYGQNFNNYNHNSNNNNYSYGQNGGYQNSN